MRRTGLAFLGVVFGVLLMSPTGAMGKDPARTALNVIPSGQWGNVPPPPGADSQEKLYDGLTPLFDNVTNADLGTYFKSESLRAGVDGPLTNEPVPRQGVQLLRDKYNVPHVKADTRSGGIWAAGWIGAEDRAFLLKLARYNSRAAAVDVPNVSAVGLIASLGNFQPSEQTENTIAKQNKVLKRHGKEGRKVLRDIDTFLEGINDYNDANGVEGDRWTRNDIFALNALKGQFVGQGGGDEARRTQFLSNLESTGSNEKAFSVFNDLRQFKNPGSPTSVDGKFKYGHIPKHAKGNVVIDPGSYQEADATSQAAASKSEAEAAALNDGHASNTLMIGRQASTTGNPLMVGGPQIGYFYPGFTYEINMNAPGLRWRGATSGPFPGYMLIGRQRDFATTLTSSSGDIIDQYAETLCGGSDTMYKYKGKCRQMQFFDAGTLNGDPVQFYKTVHGSVVGYATVNGRKVAIAQKRSSYGKDTLDQIFYRRLSSGRVHNPKTFFNAADQTPQTFNSFYIDDKNIAEFTSGKLPIRPGKVDPGLLTNGNGKYEWRGWLNKSGHIHGRNPKDSTLTNWNNIAAHGVGAADDNWGGNGSAARVDLLDYNLDRLQNKAGKWSLATVTSAMNASATQDVRAIRTVPLLQKVLKGSTAPNAQAQQMLDLLVQWRANGGNLLDLNGDGLIDDPGAAIIQGAWDPIANAVMGTRMNPDQLDELDSLFSRFNEPPGGQYDGWYQYMQRDIGELLGEKVKRPFENSYCGRGKLGACQTSIWDALAAAGKKLTADQGTSNPAAWRASATDQQIEWPANLLPPMAYTNRPSGIQQVISFKK